MTSNTLTSDERKALQMWFRQAIVEVEKREALSAITRFYQGESSRDNHKSSVVTRRSTRTRSARSHELV